MFDQFPSADWASESGNLRLYRGDCLHVLRSFPDNALSGVVTDPPYSSGGNFRADRMGSTVDKYVNSGSQTYRAEFAGDNRDQRGYLAWTALWTSECLRLSKGGAVLCSFSDWRQVPIMSDAIQAGGWTWRNLLTWWKPGARMQKGRFSSSAEHVLYATAGPHAQDGSASSQNVISCPTLTGERKQHIAEKPPAVLDWLLGSVVSGGAVLDPFAGSGSTGEACARSGRPFVGIEVDPVYFELAAQRLHEAEASFGLFNGSVGESSAPLLPPAPDEL